MYILKSLKTYHFTSLVSQHIFHGVRSVFKKPDTHYKVFMPSVGLLNDVVPLLLQRNKSFESTKQLMEDVVQSLETPYDGLVPDGVYLFSSGNDEIESAVVGVADDDLA